MRNDLKTLFVVDDNITNLEMAAAALGSDYRVLTMNSAKKMFAMLEIFTPALILLDIGMPEMDGMEALKLLKANNNYSFIPVVFLTSINNAETETQGFAYGAVDFVSKPFSPVVLKSRIKTHIDIDEIVRNRTIELINKTVQLEKMRNDIIAVLADLIESRDKNTGGHIERVKFYTKALIEAMLERGVYADEIKKWNIELVYASTKLHDVGKIAISDFILNKPTGLTEEEFEIMKGHVNEGIRIIEDLAERIDYSDFLKSALIFAAYHHEKWDGTGYPYKLSGIEIPLRGRIMALVDVYDALTTARPYKEAFSEKVTLDIIMEGSGTHFDPAIVEVFYEIRHKFAVIREELKNFVPHSEPRMPGLRPIV